MVKNQLQRSKSGSDQKSPPDVVTKDLIERPIAQKLKSMDSNLDKDAIRRPSVKKGLSMARIKHVLQRSPGYTQTNLEQPASEQSDDESTPPLLFGQSLQTLMQYQRKKHIIKEYPVILEAILKKLDSLDCYSVEGIFRTAGHMPEVNQIQEELDKHFWSTFLPMKKIEQIEIKTQDPHTAAQLLLVWLANLPEKLVLPHLSSNCIHAATTQEALDTIYQRLPSVHIRVIEVIIHFLQKLTTPQNIEKTRMGIHNIATVFAPLFVSFEQEDTTYYEDEKDVTFVKQLILKMGQQHYITEEPPPVPPPF